jgi:N-acetylglucosaminyl-diphospho-decaprenol L-rhamnosyltransferase
MAKVDVVIVSYNSRDRLRGCVEPLLSVDDVHVIVADNASPDRSLEALSGLDVTLVQLDHNGGFASGVNAGTRTGSAPYVLLLNPDARIDADAVQALVGVLDEDPLVGAVAPLVRHDDGSVDWSQRRFPRLRSTYAQALFLHRVFPAATWTDELVRDEAAYRERTSPDWVSGACLLVRRRALEDLGGLDDGFFMYCEDIDLCKRLGDAGYSVVFEPAAEVVHEGGASSPPGRLLPVLAASRIRYAQKHRGRIAALLERAGVGLGALTHVAVGRGGRAVRVGYAQALRRALLGGAHT